MSPARSRAAAQAPVPGPPPRRVITRSVPARRIDRWERGNRLAGLVIFALPPAVGLAAMAAAVVSDGVVAAVGAAVLAALSGLPLLFWLRSLRRAASLNPARIKIRAVLGLALVLLLGIALLLPQLMHLWWWTWPAAAVVISESVRRRVQRTRTQGAAGRTHARHEVPVAAPGNPGHAEEELR